MIRRRGDRFEVVVYLGRALDGRRRSISRMADSEVAAKILEGQLLDQREQGRRLDGDDAPLGHLLDRWLDVARLEESTRYQARMTLDRHVRPALGKVPVSRLRAEHLDDLYATLERGKPPLSGSAIRRLHSSLRAALQLAVRWEWIARNPATNATPPPERRREPEPPDQAVLLALLRHLAEDDPLMAVFVRVAAVTGMRRSEVCALWWSDVDFDRAEVRKTHSLGLRGGWVPYEKPTKTGDRRSIALDAGTLDDLRLHEKLQRETADHFGATLGPDAYVFAENSAGTMPLHPNRASRRFAAARSAVPGAERVLMRELRHWMVTEGLELGASPTTVSGRAGHRRTSTTTDRYGAWLPASDRALADALGGLLDDRA